MEHDLYKKAMSLFQEYGVTTPSSFMFEEIPEEKLREVLEKLIDMLGVENALWGVCLTITSENLDP